jgi:hypothetical protein
MDINVNWETEQIFWTGYDGKPTRVSEMDTGRIQNIVIMLLDKMNKCVEYGVGKTLFYNGVPAENWISVFKSELHYRGVI